MFGRKSKGKLNSFEIMFSDVSDDDIKMAKAMAFECLCFSDRMRESNIVRKATNMYSIDCIAYAKTFWRNLFTESPLIHYLAHAYFFEYYHLISKDDLETTYDFLNILKKKEHMYISAYYNFMDDDRFDYPSERMFEKFYHSVKADFRDPDEDILVDKDELQIITGKNIEIMHNNVLNIK